MTTECQAEDKGSPALSPMGTAEDIEVREAHVQTKRRAVRKRDAIVHQSRTVISVFEVQLLHRLKSSFHSELLYLHASFLTLAQSYHGRGHFLDVAQTSFWKPTG
jgi:hypothetical protein